MSALEFAQALIAAAIREGVREIVLCPGSRSAPLAYAAYAAEQAGLVRLHVRVDERSAGFLAVGLAKTSRVPAAVITTSGTAVANLHPAVLEAHHAKVPLLVLSADRPAALRGSGANQTTTQPGIFPGAVRFEADMAGEVAAPIVGTDGASALDLGAVESLMSTAIAAALGSPAGEIPRHDPGPVHLNVCLAEPLVPDSWPLLSPAASTAPAKLTRGTVATVERHAGEVCCGQGDSKVPHRTTLVVLGDLVDAHDRPQVVAWAAQHGYPVIAEPFGERADDEPGVLPHGPLLLTDATFVDAHAPERVIVVGRTTLSRPVTALLRRPGLRVEALTDTQRYADPAGVVAHATDLHATLAHASSATHRTATQAAVTHPDHGLWARAWHEAGTALAAAVADDPPAWPSGLAIARTVIDALPEDAILFTGPSNPVRDIDFGVCRVPPGRAILASRGLAGIDGCVSTAIGIALAEPDRPTYALMGDLTFLHDTNGLLIGPAEPRPNLTIVVVNDQGGGIFGLLEPGRASLTEPYERLFGTPTTTDLGALAGAHGILHDLATTPEALAASVSQTPNGLRVIEVPIDRAGHEDAHAHLRATAARANA